MINTLSGNIQINSQSTLYPYLSLQEFIEEFDFPSWSLWHWKDVNHHVCYRRECFNSDTEHFIVQVHFIAGRLFNVDLSFYPDNEGESALEFQQKTLSDLLGIPVKTHDIYSMKWGYFCVTRDELSLPVIRIIYQ